jgi:hypothetical protein
MGIRAFIPQRRQERADDRAAAEEIRALPERQASVRAEAAGRERDRQEREREKQEWLAEHGADLAGEPGWVTLARQIEANAEPEEVTPYNPYAHMTPEAAQAGRQAAESMARYHRGEPARADEERENFREWAELDAGVIEDYQEMQQRERDDEERAAERWFATHDNQFEAGA